MCSELITCISLTWWRTADIYIPEDFLLISWWLPDNVLLFNCLMSACWLLQQPQNCLKTAWQLFDDHLTIWRLFHNWKFDFLLKKVEILDNNIANNMTRLQAYAWRSQLIVLFLQYFWCQIWVQWHKLSGKNTHICFFYFWFKNKRVWAEKIGKKRKNSKNLKVAGNHPNI